MKDMFVWYDESFSAFEDGGKITLYVPAGRYRFLLEGDSERVTKSGLHSGLWFGQDKIEKVTDA